MTTKTTLPKNNLLRVNYKINWLAILVVGWCFLFLASFYEKIRPASDWFEVHRIQISTTVVREDPLINYQRSIKLPFKGNWLAELQQYNLITRKWHEACSSNGVAIYSPDKSQPDPLYLTWWTFPIDCTPQNLGIYRLKTVWTIELPGGLTKQVHATSGNFTVIDVIPSKPH